MDVEDDVFGKLTMDERFKTWDGQLTVGEQVLRLEVYALENGEVLPIMRQGFAVCQARGFDYRAEAAGELLELYNDNWNEGEPIDAVAFASRLMLENVVVERDGSVTLWYDDGDLFAGHVIFVVVEPDGTVSRAEIAG